MPYLTLCSAGTQISDTIVTVNEYNRRLDTFFARGGVTMTTYDIKRKNDTADLEK